MPQDITPTARLTWADLDVLARRADHVTITRRVIALSEPERAAFAAELEAGIRKTRGEAWWGQRGNDPAAGYALAVIGSMPSAARAATLLTRRDMRDGWGSIPAEKFRSIVEARDIPWLADLGVRLAEKLPAKEVWARDWEFVSPMLTATPELAPRTEGFVRGWLDHVHQSTGRLRGLADALRDSPFLDHLLPAVFEIDGIGSALTGGQWDGEAWNTTPRSPAALATLVAEGRLDRATVFAATVDRLVRGDRPALLRPFAMLHDALAPTVDEMAGFTHDYARLLAGAPSAIAGLAQRALRAVDDAGRLELETLIEASAATLLRAEKGLVRTQLSWLEKVARRAPERAGELMETVAVAFGHPTLDVQERALNLIARQVARLDAGAVARIADAAGALGGDLPARAAELFGVAAAETGTPGVVELAPPAPAAAMPPPIASGAELATEIVALLHGGTAVAWERVLAALVALPAAGVPVAESLRPLLDRHHAELTDHGWHGELLRNALLGDVMRVILGRAKSSASSDNARNAWVFGSGPRQSLRGGPASVLELRIRELAERVSAEPAAELMATPTRVTGALDPAVLLERLFRAEAAGREPWPIDFEQALLRVPREADPAVVTAAAELTSAAGRRFAVWLKEGGLPDPVSTRWPQTGKDGRYAYGGTPPLKRRVVAQLDESRPVEHLLGGLLVNLTRSNVPSYYPWDFSAPIDITAAALPQHREVVAAWVLPVIAAHADMDGKGDGPMLPALAECSGPVGPALTLALAYGLGARHEPDRLAAVDAFLILAAGGEPIGAGIGAEVADLCADGVVKLTRVVAALTDVHRGGGSRALWELLAAALPGLLPAGPRGLPDLLELATQVAGEVGAHDDVPGLAEVAGRAGGSRLLKEARRLRTVLAG
ncbi:hypothetical protein GCM10010112_20340 [Actinoplanes lobatus]|uniref:Secreted protein n=1 Tax=Actinoplanes lobatus TaxID=113568 RepID=A0A7W7HPN5_9ACTN|nr:DUF6493 family protein [Actinoplanes lobatus]MBB4754289.1 hypothetical protein [Actinoplanes lobatus]GGN62314.1 hypothetical protein GCM10010112_20340 [Actinoplanes lobatus]GIE46029.1 hypothetical protein Alo02nite_89270 [Actinoplanes lobatus]